MENFIIPLMNILQVGYILLFLYLIFNKSKCSRQKMADLYFISCIIAGVVLVMELTCGFIFWAVLWGLMLAMDVYSYNYCSKE